MAFWKRKEKLAGPGYIILNVIRVLNIISLLAAVAASGVMLVKTFLVSKFFFFDGLSHVITAIMSIFLIVSELPFFRGYFSRNWPLLSQSSGFVTLGLLMIVLGVSILGNLNKEATSEESLGLSFWQIVIASGILTSILGFVNIVANYIFRYRALGVTARMYRSYGAQAPAKVSDVLHRSDTARSARRSFHLGRSDTLPSYHTSPKADMQSSNTDAYRTPPMAMTRGNSYRATTTRMGLNISGPVVADPEQFAKFKGSDEVQRPDLACHPALYANRI